MSRSIAQTNLQLYNQMRARRDPDADLALVKSAYELASLLYSGHYQADGKPFVSHSIGVASILCHLDASADHIAFGLVHNVYGNGDFGDGLRHSVTAARRRRVARAVGDRVEDLVHRFRDFRITRKTISRIEADLDTFDEAGRQLLLADLADHLEKYVDDGVLYFGDALWITDEVELLGDRLIVLAERLEKPLLAEMMREGFAAVSGREPAPQVLRRPSHQKYLALTLPLSAKARIYPRLTAMLRKLRQRS